MHLLNLASLTSFLLLIAMNGVVAAPVAAADASDVQLFQRAVGDNGKTRGIIGKAKTAVKDAVNTTKKALTPQYKCQFNPNHRFYNQEDADGCTCIYKTVRDRRD
ncbi:hypothetical protein C8J56DRAFT_916880 [Mycena floridula]|nr:hypothetical protein C8J56DRAFT_916880 [Mycena floridula]